MKFLDEIPKINSSSLAFFFKMNGEFYVRFRKHGELYNGYYIKYKGKRYYSRYPLMCHYIA